MSATPTPLFATDAGAEAMFLFIAENLSFRVGTEEEKIAFGKNAYVNHKLHNLDFEEHYTKEMSPEEAKAEYARAESHRANAYENIWLERMYADLDNVYGVTLVNNIVKQHVKDGKPFDSVFQIRADKQWTTPIELDAGALTN